MPRRTTWVPEGSLKTVSTGGEIEQVSDWR